MTGQILCRLDGAAGGGQNDRSDLAPIEFDATVFGRT
jgi:hypothetical protein